MKKSSILIGLCLAMLSMSAQSISAEHFNSYRSQAAKLCESDRCKEGISIYLMLVENGDALSAKEIANIYERGGCLGTEASMAARWRNLQYTMEKESPNLSNETLAKIEELTNLCGLFTQRDEEPVVYSPTAPTRPDNTAQAILILQHTLNGSGDLIMRGSKLNNMGITLDIIGGAVCGISIGISMLSGDMIPAIVGGTIGSATAIGGIVCNILGNQLIKAGGETLRNVQLTGTGITYKF